jgi:hypothetical protein
MNTTLATRTQQCLVAVQASAKALYTLQTQTLSVCEAAGRYIVELRQHMRKCTREHTQLDWAAVDALQVNVESATARQHMALERLRLAHAEYRRECAEYDVLLHHAYTQ